MSLNSPKLYLDEHLSPRLAVQLRNHGFDVLSCRDAAMLAKSDDEQLAFATNEQRALVTFNFRDFMVLYNNYFADEKEHFGIIFSTEESTGVLLHRLLKLLNSISAEELKNQIRWLNEFR